MTCELGVWPPYNHGNRSLSATFCPKGCLFSSNEGGGVSKQCPVSGVNEPSLTIM